MRKLKYKEIAELRAQLLREQQGLCALSKLPLDASRAVLDHCHSTGQIRAVLDRGVNSLLGKIENSMKINRIDMIALTNIANNLIDYIQMQKQPLLHPTHKTAEERKQAVKKRKIKSLTKTKKRNK